MKDYNNLTQDELNSEFIDACCCGNLEIVKYLLTSSKLKKHADIHANNDLGFRCACFDRYLNIIIYLLSSPDLKEHVNIHVDKDYGFKIACENGHLEMVKSLIFDMNIEKTDTIKEFLKDEKYKDIENMFRMRELNKKLGNELDSSYNKKKNKL